MPQRQETSLLLPLSFSPVSAASPHTLLATEPPGVTKRPGHSTQEVPGGPLLWRPDGDHGSAEALNCILHLWDGLSFSQSVATKIVMSTDKQQLWAHLWCKGKWSNKEK